MASCIICGAYVLNEGVPCNDCEQVYYIVRNLTDSMDGRNIDIYNAMNRGLESFRELYRSINLNLDYVVSAYFINNYDVMVGLEVSHTTYSKNQNVIINPRPYRVYFKGKHSDFVFLEQFYKRSATVGDILLDVVTILVCMLQVEVPVHIHPYYKG